MMGLGFSFLPSKPWGLSRPWKEHFAVQGTSYTYPGSYASQDLGPGTWDLGPGTWAWKRTKLCPCSLHTHTK